MYLLSFMSCFLNLQAYTGALYHLVFHLHISPDSVDIIRYFFLLCIHLSLYMPFQNRR